MQRDINIEVKRRTQSDRTEAAKNKILDAAIRILCDDGYLACTVSSVAKTAGFTTGAVQHHYPSKTELLHAVITQRTFSKSPYQLPHSMSDKSLAVKCQVIIDTMWVYYGAKHYPVVWKILLSVKQSDTLQSSIHHFFDEARRLSESRLMALFSEENLTRDQASSIITLLSSGLRGLSLSRLSDSHDINVDVQLKLLAKSTALLINSFNNKVAL